jgi:tetratricopeptide (TPR) repeat protein
VIISGCSRKKDSFINRSWHAVGTEYNVLYNGNRALEQGRQSLNDSYFDNYWEILPVERMQIVDEITLPGETKNADFERAEEKAVKGIQKHSMNIQGKEKNPQIDESYLLLGKARYFDQRFVPAQEAFNYILFKYPASDKINQAKIWREKTNLRLENNRLAINNLNRLLGQEDIEKQDLADATSTLAQAYINLKALDTAITQLEIASIATKSNDERGRYRFIQGQLYNALEKKDSANLAFDKVIELHRKTPRIYYISAHIEKAKNFNFESGNKLEFLELLTDLEENRENRPYLDKIYYQIGEYHLANASDSLATTYYNKSLRTGTQDKFLNAMNYQVLGDMNFDKALYRNAGSYFDSTLLNLKKNTKLFRAIKRKRDNLDDVIYYEDIAQRNDSILGLINMSDDERLAFFTEYIIELKEKAEAEKEKAKLAERQKQNVDKKGANPGKPLKGGDENSGSSSFYFYNSTTVAFGKNDFIQTWGERQLEDNWRWSNKSKSPGSAVEVDEVLANATEDELFDPQFYVTRIPTEQTAIDSLSKDRNFAYYQLGLIYKEKFKEYELAKDKLQGLLKSDPEERLILPSKYNLYKIYELLGLTAEAEISRNDIIENHPESRYAIILLNPNTALAEDENSPENIYNSLYRKYENQEYDEVITECDKYIILFDGESIVPKYEFLKAVSKARVNGFESYRDAVNYIALNYPNSPEGKEAEEMLQSTLPLLENSDFIDDNEATNFKVIYQFTDPEENEIEEFVKELDEAVAKVVYFDLSTSVDFYDLNTKFVVVHGLKSIDGASGFAEILNEHENNINKKHFAISSPNYQVIQIHKNLELYLKSQ